VLLEPILPQSGRVGESLGFSIYGVFVDVDVGDSLTYGATLADGSALPDWLVFDADAVTFTGTPDAGDSGSYAIRVTATDRAGEGTDAEISLAVKAAPSGDPDGHGGTPRGGPHGQDHDHHSSHGKGHDEHDEEHARHEHRKRRDVDRSYGGSRTWQKKSPNFDFDALLDEFDRGERYEARSHADIRRGWQQVARYSTRLEAGDDDAHGLLWRGTKDLARLAPGGGHGFGFEGSTGATRGTGEFKCFEGLREGFRRL
jgi:Putative Ig domain